MIYWQAAALSALHDVTVVVTADGELPRRVKAARWSGVSLSHRFRLGGDDVEARKAFADHVLNVADRGQFDALLLHSPRRDLLERLYEVHGRRAIVIAHNPGFDSIDLDNYVKEHDDLRLVTLTERQRDTFRQAGDSSRVVRPGIPVHAFQFAETPVTGSGGHQALQLLDRLDRQKLITQVDRISPDKAQLETVRMFQESGLSSRGYGLVLAGPAQHALYSKEIEQLVDGNADLRGRVHSIGPLNGAEVEHLYRASSAVVAPAGVSPPTTFG